MYSSEDVCAGGITKTVMLILPGAGVVATVVLPNHATGPASGWTTAPFRPGLRRPVRRTHRGRVAGRAAEPRRLLVRRRPPGGRLPLELAGQFAGAVPGTALCGLVRLGRFAATRAEETRGSSLSPFRAVPGNRPWWQNPTMEAIATMVPVLPVPALGLGLVKGLGETGTGTLVALPVTGSGRCPGGRTGHAVDPAPVLRPHRPPRPADSPRGPRRLGVRPDPGRRSADRRRPVPSQPHRRVQVRRS